MRKSEKYEYWEGIRREEERENDGKSGKMIEKRRKKMEKKKKEMENNTK